MFAIVQARNWQQAEACSNVVFGLLQEKRAAKQLKTEDGPKPAPAAVDVDMKDAEADGSAAGSSAASTAVAAGAQTGVWENP